MQATCVKFCEFGAPTRVLQVGNQYLSPPAADEVLVRMLARPINPSDLIPIRGSYAHRISLPNIPGYEGVGIIEEVGEAVSKQLVGMRVLPLRGEGTWQEFVQTKKEYVVPIPDAIPNYIACQLYINPITAWVICTEVLRLKEGDVLLVNAAGSSIGRIMAQLSRLIGIEMIAVLRNDHHKKELQRLGAAHVIHSTNTTKSIYHNVMEITNGNGVAAAIDAVGGFSGTELALCVQPDGDFLTLGLLSGVPVDWKLISTQVKVNARLFHLRHWNKQVSTHDWQKAFKQIIQFIVEGKVTLMKHAATYPLFEVKEAVQCAETAQPNMGKVILIN
ncbi:zinc-dependent alcohol dehydrogenase family protein [Virgibacillus dokdonensis]|uniref:Zinc-dependent alcohol dehydrogenase family protein n=1 Tax=Virgibacillus dokdonensis TaxID=302167 RepID=A0ABU7VEX9_9BACI|nr:zinc-dependent alcohol dehydrogenase family protein [Virgibacillus dokdonensis]